MYKDIYYCNFGKLENYSKSIIFYGDSHAKVLYGEIEKLFKEKNIRGIFIENQNCKRFFTKQCLASNRILEKYFEKINPSKIYMNFRWAMRIFDGKDINTSNIFEDFYDYNKSNLTEAQNRKRKYLIDFFKTFQNYNDQLNIFYPTPEFIDPKTHNLKDINNGIRPKNIFYSEISN
ncbi:SGNH hydrolase domain-containing protein [Pelagibacteraceae bacterium]|nr:SGNH hydrolase domain-containing protein [Pelagibacteraceae bacterium]